MTRRAGSAIAMALLLAAAPAAASYGQMWLDLRPLLLIAGAVAGLLLGAADLAYTRGPAPGTWLKATLWLLPAAFALAALGLASGIATFTVVAALCIGALGLIVPAQLLALLRLPGWLRGALLCGGGLLAFALMDPPRPRENDPTWFYAPMLICWGLLGAFVGKPAEKLPSARSASTPLEPAPLPAWLERALAAPASLGAWLGRIGDRLTSVSLNDSALARGVLVFLAMYGIGAAAIASTAEPVASLLLSFSAAFPGAPPPPMFDSEAGLYYWASRGIWPSLLGSALSYPVWRRRGSAAR